MLNCFFSWLISPSLYIDFLFTDGHDTDTAKFGKVKVQNSVELKYKYYKAMLKVSSFWRGLSQSSKSDSRYTFEEENSRGHSFPWSLLCHVTFTNTYIWNTHTLRCKDELVFFKSCFSLLRWHTSSWRGVSPGLLSKELYLSNFSDQRPSRIEHKFSFTLQK